MTKIASAAATDSAMTSRAGLRLTPERIPPRRLDLAGDHAAARHAVAVIVAKRTRRVFGERVAVALPVRGAHEGGDNLEIPFGDLARLAPEVGQAEVDIELEQVDPGGLLGHAETVEKGSDGLGSRGGRGSPRTLRATGCALVRGGRGAARGPRLPRLRDRLRRRLLARLRRGARARRGAPGRGHRALGACAARRVHGAC